MSYKNLRLAIWTHPKTEELRVYVDTRYVDPRGSMIAYAGGGYLMENDDGSIGWGHGKCHISSLEDRGEGLMEVIQFLNDDGRDPITFKQLIERLNDPKFLGRTGKFSVSKWEKHWGYR